jgi:hypothetical protein
MQEVPVPQWLPVLISPCAAACCITRFQEGFLIQPRRGLLPNRRSHGFPDFTWRPDFGGGLRALPSLPARLAAAIFAN